jgi:hypothetical protein
MKFIVINSYKAEIILFLLLSTCISLSLSARRYYEPITFTIESNTDRLYYDIGYGFHKFFSVPVKDKKAVISPWDVHIGLIRSLGLKKGDSYPLKIDGSEFRLAYGEYVSLPFNPDMYTIKGLARPKLLLFWSCLFAFAGVWTFHKRIKLAELYRAHDVEIHLLVVLLLFYGAQAWLSFPAVASDTVVQQRAIMGYTAVVFSGLYTFIADSAYLLAGDPLVGLLVLQVCCVALSMLYIFKSFEICCFGKLGYILFALLALSGFWYRYVTFTEQRELTAVLALLSISIAIFSVLSKRKFNSKTSILSIVCAISATMMRYDFAGYLATVIILISYRSLRCKDVLLKCLFPTFITIFITIIGSFTIGNFIDKDSNIHSHEIRLEPFYFSNLAYVFKENYINDDELNIIEQYFDVKSCIKTYDGYSWKSLHGCIKAIKNNTPFKNEIINIVKPIILRAFLHNPITYLKYRIEFAKISSNLILSPWIERNYIDDYEMILCIISGQKNYNYDNAQYFTSLRLSKFSPSPGRNMLLNYANDKIIIRLLFIICVIIGTFLAVNFILKKNI